ncbi:hypothetical protein HY642_06485 [Candidatus Woesearchaeota archaeon]|nr:hypothetical protein [Candidatus Woesearchaeota archaeon]
MDYKLEGNRFTAVFKVRAECASFPAAGGRGYGSWYEGAGVVEDKVTGARYYFTIRTSPKGPGSPLHAHLGADDSSPQQIDPCLAQLALDTMNSKDPLPSLTPRKAQLEELVKHGLLPDDKGQLYIPGFAGLAPERPAVPAPCGCAAGHMPDVHENTAQRRLF